MAPLAFAADSGLSVDGADAATVLELSPTVGGMLMAEIRFEMARAGLEVPDVWRTRLDCRFCGVTMLGTVVGVLAAAGGVGLAGAAVMVAVDGMEVVVVLGVAAAASTLRRCSSSRASCSLRSFCFCASFCFQSAVALELAPVDGAGDAAAGDAAVAAGVGDAAVVAGVAEGAVGLGSGLAALEVTDVEGVVGGFGETLRATAELAAVVAALGRVVVPADVEVVDAGVAGRAGDADTETVLDRAADGDDAVAAGRPAAGDKVAEVAAGDGDLLGFGSGLLDNEDAGDCAAFGFGDGDADADRTLLDGEAAREVDGDDDAAAEPVPNVLAGDGLGDDIGLDGVATVDAVAVLLDAGEAAGLAAAANVEPVADLVAVAEADDAGVVDRGRVVVTVGVAVLELIVGLAGDGVAAAVTVLFGDTLRCTVAAADGVGCSDALTVGFGRICDEACDATDDCDCTMPFD